MISKKEYTGVHAKSKDLTPVVLANIDKLITACNKLEAAAVADGVEFKTNPATKSNISGQTYGGFRPQNCPQGAANSAHKTGEAVDRYDPDGAIDVWLMLPKNKKLLEELGMYFEHPSATVGWSHWSIRKPKSGNRFFYP